MYSNALNVNELLGGVSDASDGSIESASVTTMTWFIEVSGDDATDLPTVSYRHY